MARQGQGSSDPAGGAHEANASGCEIVMDGIVPLDAEILPVHAALLPIGPAGKVLYFSGSDYNPNNQFDMAGQAGIDHTRVWDREHPWGIQSLETISHELRNEVVRETIQNWVLVF